MRTLLLLWCFFSTLILLCLNVNAQSVKGKVVDAETGNPIPYAGIHLKGTTKGTTSNTRGEFILYTDEAKKPLIISYVGYQSDTILNYSDKLLTVKLKPATNELQEVIIGAGDMTREKQMKIFLTQFIGSRNKDCVIANPDDIIFTYNKTTETLAAKASQPLIIRNKRLGYKITYYLWAFSYGPKTVQYPSETLYHMETSYKGNYVFEEDTLFLTPADVKKIHKARDNAYYGSRMHFIRSVLAGLNWYKNYAEDRQKTKFDYGFNNLDTNYSVHKFNFVFNNIRANKEKVLNNIILHTDESWFTGRPAAGITYNGFERSEITFESGEILFKRPADAMRLSPDSYNESNLIWSGYMGRQRVRDLLPVDFEPSDTLSGE